MDAGRRRELESRVGAGRFDRGDAEALHDTDDLAWLGRLAHRARQAATGERVTFAVDRRLDLTGPTPVEQLVAAAVESTEPPPTEFLLVGDAPLDRYAEALRRLRAALPEVGLRALTGADLLDAERAGRPAGDVLDALAEAGLDALAGLGPEPGAADPARLHGLARERGLSVPATVDYGDDADVVARLLRVRDAGDDVEAVVPLPVGAADGRVAPAESMRVFALTRLLLPGVPVSCAWSAHGLSLAQLTLQFGVDDLRLVPGTAAPDTPAALDRQELCELVWDAGFQPVERDARYRVTHVHDPAPSLARRRAEPQRVWA
jgi:aminodeoxyfutalosine synthase